MNEQEKIRNILKQKPLFEVCSPAFIDALSGQSRFQKLDKAQVLFVHKDHAQRFYIVKRGWIKLFRETLDGTQAVVDIMPENHMFGETSIFEEDVYPYSAEAAEPSDVISLPLSLLKKEIDDNPKFAFAMLSAMARYRKHQDQELEHRTLQNASQRIGCFLLRLINQNDTHSITLHLPYDKTLLASRLGMQPETFSRALSKLRDATGIQIKGATVYIKALEQLSSYSCSACSSEFPCKDLDKKSACAS